MIVRDSDAQHALCITQIHHSEMTGALAAAWVAGGKLPAPPLPQFCISAARLHDIGWLDWEGRPDLSPDTGHPPDFLDMAKRRHLEIWRKGFEDAAAMHPLLGLLVLRHNLTLAGSDTDVAPPLKNELEKFFAETSETDARLEKEFTETGLYPYFGHAEADAAALQKLSKGQLREMNAFILLTDYISLRMCMGPERPNPFGPPPAYSGQPFRFEAVPGYNDDGAEVFMMAPWPFAGPAFKWLAPAWQHWRGEAFSDCRAATQIAMCLKPFPE